MLFQRIGFHLSIIHQVPSAISNREVNQSSRSESYQNHRVIWKLCLKIIPSCLIFVLQNSNFIFSFDGFCEFDEFLDNLGEFDEFRELKNEFDECCALWNSWNWQLRGFAIFHFSLKDLRGLFDILKSLCYLMILNAIWPSQILNNIFF